MSMMIPREARVLKIHVSASERCADGPLYRSIVRQARVEHLAGASVFLVDLSYGSHRRLRDTNSEYLFVDIPVVVEIVDAVEAVEAFHERLAPGLQGGFVTIEAAEVVRYGHHEGTSTGAGGEAFPHEAEPNYLEEHAMSMESEARRVTVYIGSSDTWHGGNLAAAIVDRCRKMRLGGATASLGVMGFGKHSRIHRAHFFGLSEDLPERIEIVDRPERIEELLPVLEEMVQGGLVIVQDVQVLRYQEHHA